jgi:hypothetical protein
MAVVFQVEDAGWMSELEIADSGRYGQVRLSQRSYEQKF